MDAWSKIQEKGTVSTSNNNGGQKLERASFHQSFPLNSSRDGQNHSVEQASNDYVEKLPFKQWKAEQKDRN